MPPEEFREPPFTKDLSQESKERTAKELEAISRRLGFSETEILSNLEQEIVNNPEQRVHFMSEWLSKAELIVDYLSEDKKINAQLGLIVRQAAVFNKAAMINEYNQTMEQAVNIAYQLGEDDIAQELINF